MLRQNVEVNAEVAPGARVTPLRWVDRGEDLPAALLEELRGSPFTPHLSDGLLDFVLATDVFYSHESVPPLVATLDALAALGPAGRAAPVLLAAGRNRQAADAFWALADERFEVEQVDAAQLDPTYRCADVDVWILRRKPTAEDAEDAAMAAAAWGGWGAAPSAEHVVAASQEQD